MVHGDYEAPPSYTYAQIIKKRGSLLGAFGKVARPGADTGLETGSGPEAGAREKIEAALVVTNGQSSASSSSSSSSSSSHKRKRAAPTAWSCVSAPRCASGSSSGASSEAAAGPVTVSTGPLAGPTKHTTSPHSSDQLQPTWSCSACSFFNHELLPWCEICESPKPAVAAAPATAAKAVPSPAKRFKTMGGSSAKECRPSVLQMLNPDFEHM